MKKFLEFFLLHKAILISALVSAIVIVSITAVVFTKDFVKSFANLAGAVAKDFRVCSASYTPFLKPSVEADIITFSSSVIYSPPPLSC